MSLALIERGQLIQQGAEARIYKAVLHPNQDPIILKHRFNKRYRHPTLDASLTRARVTMEARAIMKCLRSGVSVPGIRMVDADQGLLGIELIEGPSVRNALGRGIDGEADPAHEVVGADILATLNLSKDDLMAHIGQELAKMHSVDVIHGDLTTSNMMIRTRPSCNSSTVHLVEIVLIDFGLSYLSPLVEDKAVDLYVLERAFAATHPDSEPLFDLVLKAYAENSGNAWAQVKRRLDDVRLRGRKRSMVG